MSAERVLRGRLLIEGALQSGRLEVAGERISQVVLEGELDSTAPIIAPGLIDLHIHGFGGADPLTDLEGMGAALARAGTTAFLPTLFPDHPKRLGAHAETVRKSAQTCSSGAVALGVHLEGPFVNPLAAGALPREFLATPSVASLRAILGGDGRGVRVVTLAPELAGSAELIAELKRCGIRVSLGHSRATSAEARAAAGDGNCDATHLFNAMSPWHHREGGLAGFALTGGVRRAEIIGDLVHVGAEAFELALAARGTDGLCLISDALAGAGTGCDHFHAHGREHVVRSGAAYYPAGDERDAPQLAGSALGQLEALRGLVAGGVVSIEEGLTMATLSPAKNLGMEAERGCLREGARADLLVLQGQELELVEVLVGGKSAL